jgi:hypothetical protein
VTRLTVVKITLAVLGMLIVGYGIRVDEDWYRWLGIALLGIAAVLRFVGRKDPKN